MRKRITTDGGRSILEKWFAITFGRASCLHFIPTLSTATCWFQATLTM
jgi:hypothetical protein